jgi:RluA family pseudouridine synthase
MNKELFSVIYDDDNIVVLNKSAGLLVTPDRFDKHKKSLLVIASEYIYSTHSNKKLFVVHRIDGETSGAVVFAKNANIHRRLSMAFENRDVKKTYLAVIHGRPAWNTTRCDLPLVPNGNKRHQTIVDKYHGKASVTDFKLLSGVGEYSIVEATPETGRTHQIRVHLAALGHPIVCDFFYGKTSRGVYLSDFKHGWRGDKLREKPLLDRLGLHAWKLALPYRTPLTPNIEGDILNIEAPFPRDIAALLNQLSHEVGFILSVRV